MPKIKVMQNENEVAQIKNQKYYAIDLSERQKNSIELKI